MKITNEIIEEYINNELNYIKRYDYESGKKDIQFLEQLSNNDIKKIADNVSNSEALQEYINEEIHYYLYHYKKED